MSIRKEFEERSKDVEEYMRLLKFYNGIQLNKKEKLIATNYFNDKMEYNPSLQSQQILRSNFYIIIYNLVEATIHSIITAVIDKINDEKTPLVFLKDKIKRLHIQHRIANLQDADNKVNKTMELMQHIEKRRHDKIENLGSGVSGNVDYNYIEKLVNSIGIGIGQKYNKPISDIENALSNARRYRNSLAHGNASFSTMGSKLVLTDLEKEYKEIKSYLEYILYNLEIYLKNKNYLTTMGKFNATQKNGGMYFYKVWRMVKSLCGKIVKIV